MNNQKPYVFFGGKGFGISCLEVAKETGYLPSLVVGNPEDDGSGKDSLVKKCKELGVDVLVQVPASSDLLKSKIDEIGAHFAFSIGCSQIIPLEVIELFSERVINLHPSLLPRHRGCYPLAYAIFEGDSETGVTAHFMEKGVDSGPIIESVLVSISRSDTAATLSDKIFPKGVELFRKILIQKSNGEELSSTPQDDSLASYNKKILPGNGEIDWNWEGNQIFDFIRAMTFEPFPPASFKIGSKEMIIVDKNLL
ncbi:MAG: hypothetical protein CME70_21520 [Halobacteriovorax sp.]|nr:hypothetical protein [Halobacteriovorax sp.]|tara:strand:- start:5630 stop:6388 length:759 start_codon:yes stop_codon:yes gene_type:complete